MGAVVWALCLPHCRAWHDPVHARITRAALHSLPPAMQRLWAAQGDRLILEYSLYPDTYAHVLPATREAMRPFCEVRGRNIHNVTWDGREDIESLEYLREGIVRSMRETDPEAAARFAGVLAHFLEDSTCPAHALTPVDSPLDLMKVMLPPPAGKEDIQLHRLIEASSPEFDLGARVPVQQSAAKLLERCYRIVKENRWDLAEIVRALYTDDRPALDGYRLRAAKAGAELLADAYYTALVGVQPDTPAVAGPAR